jgi:hypothetical protein
MFRTLTQRNHTPLHGLQHGMWPQKRMRRQSCRPQRASSGNPPKISGIQTNDYQTNINIAGLIIAGDLIIAGELMIAELIMVMTIRQDAQ